MKRQLLLCAAAAATLALCGSGVHADTLAHGFNSGTGNPQDFVVTNNLGGIELGLAAQPRYSGPPVTKYGNSYSVQPGTSGGRAVWNFDFSIDTNPTDSATPAYHLSDLLAYITVSGPGITSTGYFYPLLQPPDNAPTGSTTLAQNSENLTFNFWGTSPYSSPLAGYNPNTPGDYYIQMSVFSKAGPSPLGSVAMDVNVVPLPSAAWGGFALLGGLGLLAGAKRYRRRAV